MENYKIKFIGLTPNKAKAVQQIIEQYEKLKKNDELPLKKYKGTMKMINNDLVLFKDIKVALTHNLNKNLIEKVNERLEDLQKNADYLTERISLHKSNIAELDKYIERVKEHIVETVDEENKVVTYSYDTTFFEIWLDALTFIFEFEISKEKEEKTQKN